MNKIVKYVASWEKDQSTIWLILSLFKKISRFTFPLFFSSCEKLAFLPDLVRWDIPRWRAGKAYVNETMLATTSILPFSLLLSFFSPSFPCHFPSAIFFCTFITFTYFSFHYFVLLLFFFLLFNLPPYPLSLAVHWISLLITDLTVADEFSAWGADS